MASHPEDPHLGEVLLQEARLENLRQHPAIQVQSQAKAEAQAGTSTRTKPQTSALRLRCDAWNTRIGFKILCQARILETIPPGYRLSGGEPREFQSQFLVSTCSSYGAECKIGLAHHRHRPHQFAEEWQKRGALIQGIHLGKVMATQIQEIFRSS